MTEISPRVDEESSGLMTGADMAVPHHITDEMSADACPFLQMAGNLGFNAEQVNFLMEAFFGGTESSEEELGESPEDA